MLTSAAAGGPDGSPDNLLQHGNSVVFRHRTDEFRLPNINLTVLIAFSAATAARRFKKQKFARPVSGPPQYRRKTLQIGARLRAFLF
jgi:hypothetical protein